MHFLLTNDDGIDAVGLKSLSIAALERGHKVTVCAPLTQQSAVSLINIGDTDLAFAAQNNEYFHLKEKDLTGCDNELGTNGCWHIQITKIPPKCDRVKLIFKFSRDNEAFGKTANYTVTLNVDISRARNGG